MYGWKQRDDEVIEMRCTHEPTCPAADEHDARAACVVADHWEQGWALLCNGVVVFDDGGELHPSPAGHAA